MISKDFAPTYCVQLQTDLNEQLKMKIQYNWSSVSCIISAFPQEVKLPRATARMWDPACTTFTLLTISRLCSSCRTDWSPERNTAACWMCPRNAPASYYSPRTRLCFVFVSGFSQRDHVWFLGTDWTNGLVLVACTRLITRWRGWAPS